MPIEGHDVDVALRRSAFGEKEREIVRFGGLAASAFCYDSGVAALRLTNPRGSVVVLPFMGQIVWGAEFDGVRLQMESMFREPRPARTIVETYGCLAYHAGLLRNGVPGAGDNHPLHGEMPCAEPQAAGIACGIDARGPWIAATGVFEYAMGFGAHYCATPRVVMRTGEAGCEIVMEVENLSAAPMDLMYMCHVNFAFAENARIVQPAPFTPEHVVTRVAVPSHVSPTPQYRAMMAELAANPGQMSRLDHPERFDPEQVCYIKRLRPGPDGRVQFMLERREGDAFAISWDAAVMNHTVRWILASGDTRVAAFAMPATCEPEGYTAEKRKGNVRVLASGAKAKFSTQLAYVERARAADLAKAIEANVRD